MKPNFYIPGCTCNLDLKETINDLNDLVFYYECKCLNWIIEMESNTIDLILFKKNYIKFSDPCFFEIITFDSEIISRSSIILQGKINNTCNQSKIDITYKYYNNLIFI
jgi:hypothetical protein